MRKDSKTGGILRDARGSFTIYAAFTFPIFLAALGFGLDYWSNLSAKTRLDAAADTGAIAGAKAAIAYLEANGQTYTGTQLTNLAVAAGQQAAAQAFNANAGPTQALTNVKPTVSVSYAKGAFTSTVSYATTRNNGFGGLLGLAVMSISGTATATQHQPTYINVYVLVDASQSMGIAANAQQMSSLYAATAPYNPDGQGIGCVFGCHVAQNTTVTMESVAHANNIQLRIDVARAAIYNMVQTAQANAVASNIKFAVYQMQDNPQTGTLMSQVYPASGLSSAYTALSAAMAPTSYVLDLGSNNSGGTGDSSQTASLAQFALSLPPEGDGTSASSPLNYVYVVTDGMMDTPGSACYDGHCTGAMPSLACDAIKAQGATVGVIYTTYVNIYTQNNAALGLDARFAGLVEPTIGLVSGNLSGCSSGAGWYYQATDDTDLLSAMQSLFASTLSRVIQTN
jgi:hypothetical protein